MYECKLKANFCIDTATFLKTMHMPYTHTYILTTLNEVHKNTCTSTCT